MAENQQIGDRLSPRLDGTDLGADLGFATGGQDFDFGNLFGVDLNAAALDVPSATNHINTLPNASHLQPGDAIPYPPAGLMEDFNLDITNMDPLMLAGVHSSSGTLDSTQISGSDQQVYGQMFRGQSRPTLNVTAANRPPVPPLCLGVSTVITRRSSSLGSSVFGLLDHNQPLTSPLDRGGTSHRLVDPQLPDDHQPRRESGCIREHEVIKRTTRRKNGNGVDATHFYGLPPPRPTAWGPQQAHGKWLFSYTKEGELDCPKGLSKKEVRMYLKGSKPDGHPSSEWKDRKLLPGEKQFKMQLGGGVEYALPRTGVTLWLGWTPAQCKDRYPRASSHKCIFRNCPKPSRAIGAGEPQVIFDERFNEDGARINPYHNAAYAHLFCLEKAFDLHDLWQLVNVRFDTRRFKKEDANHGSLDRDGSGMTEAAAQWHVKSYKAFMKHAQWRQEQKAQGRHLTNGEARRPWVYEDTLCACLVNKWIQSQESRLKKQKARRQAANPNTMPMCVHMGNLDVAEQGRRGRRDKKRNIKEEAANIEDAPLANPYGMTCPSPANMQDQPTFAAAVHPAPIASMSWKPEVGAPMQAAGSGPDPILKYADALEQSFQYDPLADFPPAYGTYGPLALEEYVPPVPPQFDPSYASSHETPLQRETPSRKRPHDEIDAQQLVRAGFENPAGEPFPAKRPRQDDEPSTAPFQEFNFQTESFVAGPPTEPYPNFNLQGEGFEMNDPFETPIGDDVDLMAALSANLDDELATLINTDWTQPKPSTEQIPTILPNRTDLAPAVAPAVLTPPRKRSRDEASSEDVVIEPASCSVEHPPPPKRQRTLSGSGGVTQPTTPPRAPSPQPEQSSETGLNGASEATFGDVEAGVWGAPQDDQVSPNMPATSPEDGPLHSNFPSNL